MRVVGKTTEETRGHHAQSHCPERGAVLPLVGILAVVLFGIGAIAVDLGHGWATRRSLITATDAGARAAAQEFATGGNGCGQFVTASALANVTDYVVENVSDATNISCDPNLAEQYVTVDADANVETFFAPVLGLGDFDATSSSTVRWGNAQSATGLRPIALCDKSDNIAAWLANPNLPLPNVEVPLFNKDGQPEECNGDGQGQNIEGNWGVLDFDGTGGQKPNDMVLDGYDGEVIAGDPTLTCASDPASCYTVKPGQVTSIKQKLEQILGDEIVLPIVNYVEDSSGRNVEFHVIGFARVTIDELNLTGNADQRSITISFKPGLITGTCCSTTGGPSNVNVIQACAVDRENIGSCSP